MGILGIIIAIILVIYLAMKGFNIVFVAPVASIIVIITNGMDFFPSLIGTEQSFMTGLASFIINYFAIFLLGGILASYIEKSGAAQSIAQKILSITGTKKPFPVLLAIFLISAILTFGGISVFVVLFVIIPLAKPLFKQLNISWSLIVIPLFLGIATFTMTMLPGTPSIHNVIPTTYLGTSVTAAPLIGVIASVVTIVVGILYMLSALKRSLAKNETFDVEDNEDEQTVLKECVPPFLLSITPLIVLIVIIFGGSAMDVDNIVLIGLAVSIVFSSIIFHRYIRSHKETISFGTDGSIKPIFLTAASVAFGVVITLAPSFKDISNFILEIPGNPLISLAIATTTFGAVTGSASGGLGIAMEAFSVTYSAIGVDPEAMHRISAIASAGLTALPHSGTILSTFALTGLTHEKAFKYSFLTMTIPTLSALVVALVIGILFY